MGKCGLIIGEGIHLALVRSLQLWTNERYRVHYSSLDITPRAFPSSYGIPKSVFFIPPLGVQKTNIRARQAAYSKIKYQSVREYSIRSVLPSDSKLSYFSEQSQRGT